MNNNPASGCQRLDPAQTAALLKAASRVVILTHSSPDGDTLGSAFALCRGLMALGKTVSVLCPDEIPAKYGYFVCETPEPDGEDALVVAVDVADAALLGHLRETYEDRVDLCIDHHVSNKEYAKNLLLDATASATGELIYELLLLLEAPMDRPTAEALYTGIATDTGCFKYTNVTARTHRIAADLYEMGIGAGEINRVMFDTKSRALMQLEQMVLQDARYYFDGRCYFLTVTSEMQQETGCSGTELERIAVLSRTVEGVQAGVTLKQTGPSDYKVSLRTFEPLDASAICKRLGGGGHKAAAGATLLGTPEEVRTRILEAVQAELEQHS